MKKIVCLIWAMLTICGHICAQPFTANDVVLPKGGKVVMRIALQNSDFHYMGFQFVVSVPKGITIEENSLKKIGDFVSTTHSLGISLKSTNEELTEYQIISLDIEHGAAVPLGEIISLTLVSDETGSVGETYDIVFKDIELTTLNAEPKVFDNQSFSIIIGEPADPWVTLDENSTSVPEATDDVVDIKVKRTINANEWSTLVLPFDMTEAQVKAAFGDDVQLADFVSYDAEYDNDDNVTAIDVSFSDVDVSDGIEANYPYLIKTSNDISEFFVTAQVTPIEDDAIVEYDNGLTGKRRHVYGTFYGTYHAGTVVPNGCLFISGNKFWYSKGLTQMKAFRAYFEFEDILASFNGGSTEAKVNFVFGEQTSIGHSTLNIDQNNGWYTLDGRRLNKKPKANGVYIHNGKKVVIK